MRYLLVGNPTAQSGRAKGYLTQAVESLRNRGHEVELLHTEPAGRTMKLVTDAVEQRRPDVVITFGGDGTFNEVATGLLATTGSGSAGPGGGIPLGMLPMGTANNQGRSLGLDAGPDAIETNLDVIVAGHVIQLDVGRIARLDARGDVSHESLFFDSVGWGMQPEILEQRNRDREVVKGIPVVRDLWRDQAVYAGATVAKLLESYVEPVKFTAVIVCEGTSHRYEGLTDLVISNTALYAGEWIVDRDSEPDDGLLELVPFQGRRDWLSKTIRDLVKLDLRQEDLDRIGVSHSEGFQGSHFEVELLRISKDQIATQVDGEVWSPGYRFVVNVVPQKLPLITPADFVPPWR